MLTNKKKIATSLVALSLFVLVGCDTDEIKYPSNYNDKIIENIDDKIGETAQDTFKQYYQSLTNDDAVYEKATKKVLTLLADNVYGIDEGKKGSVYSVVNDTLNTKSIADGYEASAYAVQNNDNLTTRGKESLFSTAKGGSYKDENMWDESKYAKYLEQNYYYLSQYKDGKVSGITTDKASLKNMLVAPEMKFDDVYASANQAAYNTYMQKELFDDFKINYLTAEYIMKKTPASIGNTNARKVQVVSIVDRSDEPGDAIKLLTAYVNAYILHKDGFTKNDDDFSTLTKLWKGLTMEGLCKLAPSSSPDGLEFENDKVKLTVDDDFEEIKKFFARYLVTLNADGSYQIGEKSLVFTQADEEFFDAHNLDSKDTLLGKVLSDKDKIVAGYKNWHKLDTSLESTYTGSYTYSVDIGFRNAIDDIVTRDLITEGTYLKSSGISSLPSGLTDRIFSPRVTSSKSDIEAMKNDVKNGSKVLSDKKDLTVYAKDNHRYMTVADTITSDDVSSILYYDASSKTYYITRILDVVDTNAVSSGSDSIYDTDEKKTQLKREVAYEMASTGSYKTDSGVYWLSRMDFSFSDEAFLEYIKTNYKDVFKTENPYSSEKKISLKDFAA